MLSLDHLKPWNCKERLEQLEEMITVCAINIEEIGTSPVVFELLVRAHSQILIEQLNDEDLGPLDKYFVSWRNAEKLLQSSVSKLTKNSDYVISDGLFPGSVFGGDGPDVSVKLLKRMTAGIAANEIRTLRELQKTASHI